MAPRLTRFTCYWCQRSMDVRHLHHKQKGSDGGVRRCCNPCHENKRSTYRKIYPEGSHAESGEIARYTEHNV